MRWPNPAYCLKLLGNHSFDLIINILSYLLIKAPFFDESRRKQLIDTPKAVELFRKETVACSFQDET